RGGTDAVEAHARAVGRDGEYLSAVVAIDLRGIDAIAALKEVGAVARVPDHTVVAALAEHLVVASTANQHIVAVAALEEVVAVAAVDRETDRAGGEPRGIDGVVAGAAIDDQSVVRRFSVEDGDRRGGAGDEDHAIDGADVDVVVAGPAVDRHRIRRAITAAG